MKKLLSAILIVALVVLAGATAFAGGQTEKKAAEPTGPVTLRYMEHADRFNIAPKLNAMFEEKHPNVKVEFVLNPQQGADYVHNKLVTMLAAKDGTIDVFLTDVIWPPELAAAGWLLPLDDWFTPELQKQHVAAMIDAQTVGGHVYGVPTLNDIGHFFYRVDLLEGGGMKVPVFWQDMVEIAQKLQGPNMIGYAACFYPDQQLICNYVEYLWSNGGEFLDVTGKKVRFTEKASVDAVQFMVDLVNKYKVVQPGITTMVLDDGRVIFTEGRAVFHRNWNYAYSMGMEHPESKIKGKVGTSVVPRFQNGPHSTCLGGWSYSVNAFTKNKELAVELAMFFGGPEVQKIRALEADRTPTILSLLGDPDVLQKYPVYKAWQTEADKAKARPKSPFYTQLSDIFQRELQEALLMRKTPAEAMKAAADEITQIIQ
jgi:multiple sugar transport system substrate-binding protein